MKIPPTYLKDEKKLEDYVHEHIFPRVSQFERNYLAQYFTVLFSDSFASGTTSAWSSESGAVIVSTPTHGSNAYSCKLFSGDVYQVQYNLSASIVQMNLRFYVQWSVNPASGEIIYLAYIINANSDPYQVLIKNVSGTMEWGLTNSSMSNAQFFSTPNPTANIWYCVEIQGIRNVSVVLYINGFQVGAFTVVAIENALFSKVRLVAGYSGGTTYPYCYYDDVVVADSYISPYSPCIPNSRLLKRVDR